MPEEQSVPHSRTISQASHSDAAIQQKIQDFVDNEHFRERIIKIIDERTDSTDFRNKVRDSLKEELDNAYSSNRHEAFQTKVQEIGLAQFSNSDAQQKLNLYVDGRIEAKMRDKGWKSLTFWIPTIIAAAAVIVALIKK
ncbi:hypothetical protein [Streptomyces geranii]|uniref:hypothetical protein n=1 Tax=Streptomyces geranii TaxID=2058923 RepID=UPI00130023FB|nr:hypothetical protein [Streptomyces geranii]